MKKEWEQLKSKSVEELQKEVTLHRERLWSLKVDLAAGKVKNVKEILRIKKNIARMLGLIRSQKLAK